MDLEDEMAAAQESDLQPEDGYINPMGRIELFLHQHIL